MEGLRGRVRMCQEVQGKEIDDMNTLVSMLWAMNPNLSKEGRVKLEMQRGKILETLVGRLEESMKRIPGNKRAEFLSQWAIPALMRFV